MTDDAPTADATGFVAQLRSFARPFWAANFMELLERLAYYGVRVVIPIYIASSEDPAGLHFDNVQKGAILGAWALTQTIVSMFVGGFADRYGTKRTIAASIGLKVLGYAGMATQRSYLGFFLACQMLAMGTAVFKPGTQGTVALGISRKNAALGWGVFYEVVNVGGVLGPPLAHALHAFAWKWVFFSCAAIVSLNLLTLLTYDEPARSPSTSAALRVLIESVTKLMKPRLLVLMLIMAGFWGMYMQLFDSLPNYIEEWTDSADVVRTLGLHEGQFASVTPRGLQVPQEWMINLDSALIVLFVMPMSYVAARLKRLHAIALGLVIGSVALLVASGVPSGWACLGGIALFSMGEMLSGPAVYGFLGVVAPKGDEALYMGYVNVPVAVGWTLSDVAAGKLYDVQADKANLALLYLRQHALAPEALPTIARTDAMARLEAATGLDARGATELLWRAYHPYVFWYTFAGVGLVSAIAMLLFARWARRSGGAWYA